MANVQLTSRDKLKHQISQQCKFVVGHDFYVTWRLTLYYDCKRHRCCNRRVLSLITMNYCDMLHCVVPHSSGIL